jgi:hypothetical protein
MIRMRLTVLFLTTAWLALAGLSSAISHFANILQDRAKSDLANATDYTGYHFRRPHEKRP